MPDRSITATRLCTFAAAIAFLAGRATADYNHIVFGRTHRGDLNTGYARERELMVAFSKRHSSSCLCSFRSDRFTNGLRTAQCEARDVVLSHKGDALVPLRVLNEFLKDLGS